jgi:hypothetical protein
MDISFSEQDLQFQEEIRAALANDYPAHVREKQEQGMVLSKQDMIDFHKFLYEKKLGWIQLACRVWWNRLEPCSDIPIFK